MRRCPAIIVAVQTYCASHPRQHYGNGISAEVGHRGHDSAGYSQCSRCAVRARCGDTIGHRGAESAAARRSGGAHHAVLQLGPPGYRQARPRIACEAGLHGVDRLREDAGVDGGGDGGRSGGGSGDVLWDLTSVQGVGELSIGGAVRISAPEGDGATDVGGGVLCGRVVGDASWDACVVLVLWVCATVGGSV